MDDLDEQVTALQVRLQRNLIQTIRLAQKQKKEKETNADTVHVGPSCRSGIWQQKRNNERH